MTIKTKLLIAFLSITTIVLSGGILGIYEIIKIHESSELLSLKNAPLEKAALRIKHLTTESHLWIEEIMGGTAEKASMSKVVGKIDESLMYCDAMLYGKKINDWDYIATDNDDIADKIKEIKTKLIKFKEIAQKRFINKFAEKKYDDIKLDDEFDRVYVSFIKLSEETEIILSENVKFHLKNLDEAKLKGITILVIVTLISFIASLLLSIIFSTKLTNSIKEITLGLDSLEKGDLTIKIKEETKNRNDEMGKMANSLENVFVKLNEVISNFTTGSNIIKEVSNEFSKNAQVISQGASQQASAAQEVSASMEEMSASIQQNSDNSQQTNKIASNAVTGIKEGSESFEKTIQSMKTIAKRILIIRDIAFQTNILALNAAVEAARAGKSGKGFAVVASEVRKLAERSQKAAKDINQLTSSSVNIAEKSGKILNEIVPEIENTSNLVSEITSASMEQNSGLGQINNAISSLNQVTQQNAASSEELATSAEELTGQTEQLYKIASYFKLEKKIDIYNSLNTSVKKEKVDTNYSFKGFNSTKGFNINLKDGEDGFEKF